MPAKSHNQSIGKKGENIARTFLERAGYEVVMANYRSGRGEIDLIARLDNLLVFVEVKTRTTTKYGNPEEAVTPKKAEKLIETADNFILEQNWEGMIRFDIISVDLKGGGQVLHFEDAFH